MRNVGVILLFIFSVTVIGCGRLQTEGEQENIAFDDGIGLEINSIRDYNSPLTN